MTLQDDFCPQAINKFERAVAGTREAESRMRQLINVKESFDQAAKQQLSSGSQHGSSSELLASCSSLADEAHRLLRAQHELEKKFPGKNFVGMPLHQTISDLLQSEDSGQAKQADKLRYLLTTKQSKQRHIPAVEAAEERS